MSTNPTSRISRRAFLLGTLAVAAALAAPVSAAHAGESADVPELPDLSRWSHIKEPSTAHVQVPDAEGWFREMRSFFIPNQEPREHFLELTRVRRAPMSVLSINGARIDVHQDGCYVDSKSCQLVEWMLLLVTPDGEFRLYSGSARVSPRMDPQALQMTVDALRHDDLERICEGHGWKMPEPWAVAEKHVALVMQRIEPLPDDPMLRPLSEGVPPNGEVRHGVPYVSWKFTHNGKQYGNWRYLESEWQIANMRLLGSLWAEEHRQRLWSYEASKAGIPSTNNPTFADPPENLRLFTGVIGKQAQHQEELTASGVGASVFHLVDAPRAEGRSWS